jgi:hypothetical protein
MFDIRTTAKTIAAWPGIVGIDAIPSALRESVELFDSASFVSEPYITVKPETITADNIESVINGLASDLSQAAHFTEARKRVVDALGQHLLQIAGESVEAILEKLRPGFEQAVENFTIAVGELGDDLTPAALVRCGPVALQRYTDAVTAQDEMLKADQFLSTLRHLPIYGVVSHEPCLRLTSPSNRDELKLLLNYQGKRSEALGDLLPLLVHAVKGNIRFSLNDPATAKAIQNEINSSEFVAKKPRFMSVNR